jgi:hypothetical protein
MNGSASSVQLLEVLLLIEGTADEGQREWSRHHQNITASNQQQLQV